MRCPLREYKRDARYMKALGIDTFHNFFTNQTIEWYIRQHINRELSTSENIYLLTVLIFFRIIPKEFACKEFIEYVNSNDPGSCMWEGKKFKTIVIEYIQSIIPNLTNEEMSYLMEEEWLGACATYSDLERNMILKAIKIRDGRKEK